jgi:uncharacterized iron-regulated membrane protein
LAEQDLRTFGGHFAEIKARRRGAGVNFLLAAMVLHLGALGTPVALTAIAFGLGLLIIPFAIETKGESLPE